MSNVRPPVLLVVDRLVPDDGGLYRAVHSLGAALMADGAPVDLLATRLPSDPPLPPGEQLQARTVPRARGVAGRLRSSTLRSAVREWVAANPTGVVHLHGVWRPEMHAACVAADRAGAPIVLSAHGMLMEPALRQKWLKKTIGGWLYQWRDLRRVRMVHAASAREANSMRDAGFRFPITVVAHGVDRPPAPDATGNGNGNGNGNGRSKIALFLSRIHPGKGLTTLIDAWRDVRPDGWKLRVAGCDIGGHLQVARERAAAAGLNGAVEFTGPAYADHKWQLYRDADLFALPTVNESFGLVIGEALICGVPVITTREAPWPQLVDDRCGRWIDNGLEPLTRALGEMTSMPDAERREMGERGRVMVERTYSWARAADGMANLYRELTP